MVILTASLLLASHRTFFVAANGNDSLDGRSVAHAWKSLERVGREKFRPGDSVWLASGQTFLGSLTLNPASRGALGRPVTIGSRGAPAIIDSGGHTAITISSPGVRLTNLVLRGNYHGEDVKKEEHETGLKLIATGPEFFKGNSVDHLDIGHFHGDGLTFSASKKNPNGFDGLKIALVFAHDNEGTGISSDDSFAYLGKTGANKNILITDCEAKGNLGGSGITLSGLRSGLVQYCKSVSNIGKGGGVGIWAWAAQGITFRYCIAEGTRSGGGDGGGFDLDGATEECVVDHCLSYDNSGPGYMHCDYPTAPFTRRNLITSSISIDDGVKEKSDSTGFGFVTWGSGLDDCTISNNLSIRTKSDPKNRNFGALFVTWITGSTGPKDVLHVKGCKFENNIVQVEAPGVAFVKDQLENPKPGDLLFQGNLFRSDLEPAFVEGRTKPKSYDSLAVWQKAIGAGSGNRTSKHVDFRELLSRYRKLEPRDLPKMRWPILAGR